MARSHSIYVLFWKATGEPVGAFTVKHEMNTVRDRVGRQHTYYLAFRDNQPDVAPKLVEDEA